MGDRVVLWLTLSPHSRQALCSNHTLWSLYCGRKPVQAQGEHAKDTDVT